MDRAAPTDTTATLTGAAGSNGSGPTSWQIQLGPSPTHLTSLVASGTIPDGIATLSGASSDTVTVRYG